MFVGMRGLSTEAETRFVRHSIYVALSNHYILDLSLSQDPNPNSFLLVKYSRWQCNKKKSCRFIFQSNFPSI